MGYILKESTKDLIYGIKDQKMLLIKSD